MIVLDTNVLSEILRPTPDARVLDWLAAQSRPALFTTTVTRGELFYGLQLMPEGQRKTSLLAAVQAIFDHDLAGKVLSFDSAAADAYAVIAASRRIAGKPISQFDAMIAAIAQSRGAGLATRNIRDFEGLNLRLIDPWET